MSEIELNKDGLFLLAKKIISQNYSFPKCLNIKNNKNNINPNFYNSCTRNFNNLSKKDSSLNESKGNATSVSFKKKRFKNRFLEKDNIQINEEKMLNLLSEKKREKIFIKECRKKFLKPTKLIYINLKKNENFNKFIGDLSPQNSKEEKKFKKHINKCGDKKYEITISDYFDNNNNMNNNIIIDRNNMSRINSEKTISNNYNLNKSNNKINCGLYKKFIEYSIGNEEEQINCNLDKNYFSLNKDNNFYMNKMNEVIDDKVNNVINSKKINNNIKININLKNSIINNNIVNINHIKKVDNSGSLWNTQKFHRKQLKSNKLISYCENASSIKNIKDNYKYSSYVNNTCINKKNNIKDLIGEKINKKYNSPKYYLKDNNNYKDKYLKKNKSNNQYIVDINSKFFKKDNEKKIKTNYFEENGKKTIQYFNNNTHRDNNYLFSEEQFNTLNKNYSNMKYLKINKKLISKINKSNLNKEKNLKDSKIINYRNDMYNTEIPNKNFISDNIYNTLVINSKEKKLIKRNKNKIKTNKSTEIITNKVYNITSSLKLNNINNNNKDVIKLEDLLILDEKLSEILDSLNGNPFPKILVEWWNFYTYSSFFGKFPKLFLKKKKDENVNKYIIFDYQISHDAIMLELLSIIITYQIINDSSKNKNLINIIKNLINEIHQNFLIECDYILSTISNNTMNFWIKSLKSIILSKKKWNDINSKKNDYHFELLKKGNSIIQTLIENILTIYFNENSSIMDINLLKYFNEYISKINLMELVEYFNKIINQENKKINKYFTCIFNIKSNIKSQYEIIKVPYLPEEIEGKKYFTLVLDLDETLISFRINESHRGILRMRHGLYNFLKSVRNRYELVVFTSGIQEYADPILDIIEKKGKIFAKRLYRQHTIIINNKYIKDLSRLGRDLSKIIIVDNMPQNFGLQKENGILIKNFFGEDKNDNVLKYLSSILFKISSKSNNDVRNELRKYRKEIFMKITTNLNI